MSTLGGGALLNKEEVMEPVQCDSDGCEEMFIRRTHNQRYHNNECCRLQTNRRLIRNYHAKQDKRKGKIRYCAECSETRLSRYNDEEVCAVCKSKKQRNANNAMLAMFNNTSITA